MPFKVQVGPHQVSIHQGQAVSVSEPDGGNQLAKRQGPLFHDTRLVSSWAIYADGNRTASRSYLTNREILTSEGIVRRARSGRCPRSTPARCSRRGGCPREQNPAFRPIPSWNSQLSCDPPTANRGR
jgi:hypothetical protein